MSGTANLFRSSSIPLAERMRPFDLDGFVGQDHLVGEGQVIYNAIHSGRIPSMIFWGPPGTGKTTLANIITKELNRTFFQLSAISSGVKDVREVIKRAEAHGNAVLFIDEIHRFNKAQQDSLLGAVEKGVVTLIGATTENPSFEVISALLSRCQVYILEPLGKDQLWEILNRAIDGDHELQKRNIEVKEEEALFRLSGGDARKLLTLLEIVVDSLAGERVIITNELVMKYARQKMALYDKTGEQHYDIISAFIKSIRGSDPNAAMYWLARMVEGGEDPKFIARRLVILASEDIGMANPTALALATNGFQAVNLIGYPECRIILAQITAYLASSPKSNASYMAIKKAEGMVRKHGDLPVPLSIRNAPTKLMKELDYGKEYQYAHQFEGNFAPHEFMPDELSGYRFYEPGNNPREVEIRKRLKKMWEEKYGY